MKKFALLASILLSFFIVATVWADPPPSNSADPVLVLKSEAEKTLNQLPSTNPQEVIGQVVKLLMAFMGAIMFMLVVYAGFIWMTAQGNGDKIEQAKNIILWSGLGVAAMLSSYIVVQFIFTQLNV